MSVRSLSAPPLEVGGRMQATPGDILLQQLRKTRLVNRCLASVYLVHLVLIDIDTDYLMSLLHQAHARH